VPHRAVIAAAPDSPAWQRAAPVLLDAAFELSPIGMAFCDTEGRYVRVNPAMARTLGRPAADLVGVRDQDLTHPDDRQTDLDLAARIMAGELDTCQVEKRFVRPDGTLTWVIANLAFLRDDERRPLAWIGQFQDITEHKVLQDHLHGLAHEDPLTGLPNRRRFDTAMRRAVAAERGALLVLDLDDFKAINDDHGHGHGDAVLRHAAQALRGALRAGDLVVRLGGDEFAVLLRGADAAGAAVWAARARRDLREGPAGDSLSASIGVTLFAARDARTPAQLLHDADRAMYADKRQGGAVQPA
jgi:diguanylate cyclase (GGDEF)-like protein/PAS domain S-box-containing protein